MKAVQVLKEMINSGVNNLYNFYPQTDKLNVFPVPDGDTGTNMNLTCTNGFAEIEHDDNLQPKEMLTRFARGLIMGARGNSGVIFSQIMKGFAMGFNEDEVTTTAAT
jgi:dihydroxyacetone kinase-like predicted kinase